MHTSRNVSPQTVLHIEEVTDEQPHANPGMVAPDFPLPRHLQDEMLSDLRGTPVVLIFSAPGWNPSAAEQFSFLQTLLAECAPSNVKLHSLRYQDVECRLEFESPPCSTSVFVLHDFDTDGAIAEMYGLSGQRAVIVIDAEGLIREKNILPPGTLHGSDDIKLALEFLQGGNGCAGSTIIPAMPALPMNRRQFLATALAASVALSIWPHKSWADEQPHAVTNEVPPLPATHQQLNLSVNGRMHALELDTRVTLLDALREKIGLTGTKKGCDQGTCGACTVIVDGRRIKSCLTLAAMEDGKKIVTIEGLTRGNLLHPMQQAFIDADALQCGYCTPGQIMSAVALLDEGHAGSAEEIREWMSGNICRCGAYVGIVQAIQQVSASART